MAARVELVEPVEGKDAHDSIVTHKHSLTDAFKPIEPLAEAEGDDPEAVDTSRFVHAGADAYAILLLLLAVTGMFVLKGKKGLSGRGKWFVVAGLVLPVVFLIVLRYL